MNKTKLLLIGAVPAMALSCTKAPEKKMNIIYIMSDDHTSQAVGAYNHPIIGKLNPTPTIDKLAAEGILFDNCFCSNAISTPSRSTIITGQYSHHNSVLTLEEALREDQEYLPLEMKKLGYQTAMLGKWHLDCEPSAFDFYKVLVGNAEQGTYFDPILASSEINDKKYPNNIVETKGHSTDVLTDVAIDWLENKRDKEKPFFLMHHYKAPHDFFQYAPRYEDYLADVEIPLPPTLFNREGFGSVATRGENDSLVHFLASSISDRNHARSYIKSYGLKGGKDDTIKAYNRYVKSYLRCVKGVDDNLARLFKYLKDNDLWENTIIVYTGDQGMILGEHDLQDKRWMYEESLRMPFIVKIPDSPRKGVHEDMLIGNVDFAPTLLALAGKKEVPEYMDGDDFSPIFFSDKEPEGCRQAHYYRYWMHLWHHWVPAHFGIRTKEFKLIFFYGLPVDANEKYGSKTSLWVLNREKKSAAKKKAQQIAAKKRGKAAPVAKAPLVDTQTPAGFELYDMVNDKYETTNLANDPAYKDVLERLKKQLLETRKEVGDEDLQNPEILEIIKANF